MNFTEIKNNIRHWNEIRTNSRILKDLFNGKTFFNYSLAHQIIPEDEFLHIYPAIADGELVFYLIESSKDKRSVYDADPQNFATNITRSAALSSGEMDAMTVEELPAPIAKERIANWVIYGNDWIDASTQDGGIYQAFTLPLLQVPEGELTFFFALKETDDPANLDFSADLIISRERTCFHNTVRPVPPFGQEGEAAFWVLETALEKAQEASLESALES